MIRILVVLLAFGYCFSSSNKVANVLLFTIDSCRADRFGVYGYAKDTTPNIDRWAKTGTVFTSAYSTSAWTAPGLVSVLTGLYPTVHGVNNRDRMGPPTLLTLHKLFRSRGYRVPNLNFFTFAPYYKNLGLGRVERQYFGRQAESPFLNWLERNLEGPDQAPFFLWFHVTTVHQPYRTSPEKLEVILKGTEPSHGIQAVMKGAIVPFGSTDFEESDRPVLDALYDDEIRRVDHFFGRVLESLSAAGFLETTLVVMTADHGEELLDHGFVGHASTSLRARLYEEFIHIPLIVSWPGKVPVGEVDPNLVSQIDILPTISALLGWEIPSYVQGTNLLESSPEHRLFFESVVAGNQTTKEKENIWVRGVRTAHHKYISTGELYDLTLDPREQVNIADQDPEIAKKLSISLGSWLKESEALRNKLFPPYQSVLTRKSSKCPGIHTPARGSVLDYDLHTGALLFGWTGDMETTYLIEYDIGVGDHHVAGTYEIDGNHQILGPFPRELWENLKAWNPFRFRVSPKSEEPCWSRWTEFKF
jgi:arylsulfatase A-like enzyme